jgi:hypothetical protein
LNFDWLNASRNLSISSRQVQEIKGIQIGKKEVKLFLFAEGMIPYLKDSKNSTKKLLQMINSFGKVAGYKIIYACVYTNHEQTDKKNQGNNPIYDTLKNI